MCIHLDNIHIKSPISFLQLTLSMEHFLTEFVGKYLCTVYYVALSIIMRIKVKIKICVIIERNQKILVWDVL